MTMLCDQIIAGILPTGMADGGDRLRSEIGTATVIGADNVADYFFATKGSAPGHAESWSLSDFPNVAPPLASMWVEFRHALPWGARRVGVILQSSRRDPGWTVDSPDGRGAIAMPDGGWQMCATAFMQDGSNRIDAMAEWTYFVMGDGAVATLPGGEAFTVGVPVHPMFEAAEAKSDGGGAWLLKLTARQTLFPALLAISFMHCKNVERREVEQPAWDRRAWQKKHKRPLVRYHVLDIDPMRKVLRDEGGSETHGLKKALHICRGHFATYTEEAPLFGRITGTFWKPQHVRGNAKSGVVVKDYRVKSP